MRKTWSILLFLLITANGIFSQIAGTPAPGMIFRGIVIDATTLSPIPQSQILINGDFAVVSDEEGEFTIQVKRKDSVEIRVLGYKTAAFHVGDTLAGNQFLAGIYMNTDTLSIGEVVIVPGLANLKSEILRPSSGTPQEIDNAKYNLAISAYQGRVSQSRIGDPESNYEVLRQMQRIDAYERGGIPSDKIVGLSPFMLIPAAYLLIHGFSSTPPPMKSNLTKQEIDRIHKKYVEKLNREE